MTGMRNGGRGYLALDVTDPNADATDDHGPYPKLLFEFSDPNQPLGLTWSRPVIGRVKLKGGFTEDNCGAPDGDGATALVAGNCRERWVAIFGGGYLEQGDPNIPASFLTDPNAAGWTAASKSLFIVALDTGQVLARASFDSTSTTLREMKCSFPSEPAVLDINFDGFADLIYIGDTCGQLWKWDISAVAQPTTTGMVSLSTWPIGRFFTAPAGSNGHRRSFFYPPTASLVNGVLTLGIGTGERTNLEYQSVVNNDENQFYVIQDTTPTGTGAFTGLPLTISSLTELNDQVEDPDPADKGFFLRGQANEKFVTDSITFGGFIIAASYTPSFSASDPNGECEAQGDATLYIFGVADGAGYFDDAGDVNATRRLVVGAGLPTSPSITVAGNLTKVVLQTSDGRVIRTNGPNGAGDPVELIYWRQQL
jgi:type IV pilus assembly protein PilY1